MNIELAHAVNEESLFYFKTVYSLEDFSIAEICESMERQMPAFSHSHDDYEFVIPLKTIPLLVYDKANYIGEVGYVYPVNPFVEHGVEFPFRDSRCLDIVIKREYVDEMKKELGYDNTYFYTRFNYPSSLIELIRKCQKAFEVDNHIQVEGYKKIITTQLIELGLESGADNRRPEKAYRKNIRNIVLYMYDKFRNKDMTINSLAFASGFSLAYFTKSFKAYMHDTPIMHLNKLRISEAKYLMTKGIYKFNAIANMVGYSNLSTFTESFKNIVGCTPSEYKKKYIKK